MSDRLPVYRTPGEDDARFVAELLAESGIASELVLEGGETENAEAVLFVAADAEAAAVKIISEHLEGRGLRPEDGAAPATGVLCPNCARPAAAGEACPECGYAVKPGVGEPRSRVADEFPDALSVCADCCAPSTKAAGPCPDCGGDLAPADLEEPVCPAGAHVLVKGDGDGWVCPGCRSAWLPGDAA